MEFTVFPDSPSAEPLVRRLEWDGAQVLHHASGRPWVVGRWHAGAVVDVVAGAKRLVLLGRSDVGADELRARLARLPGVEDLDRVLSGVPGCFHALLAIDGDVRVQGNIAANRRIFHTTADGVPVAADRPERIAVLAGSRLDERVLALHLLAPYGPPWPLSDLSPWRGVRAVAGGHYLRMRPDGEVRDTRWWRPPEPEVALPAGREVLRAALEDAVRTCGGRDGTALTSFDLSGGMDSTSLCFLAGRAGLRFSTVHHESADPANADHAWAEWCRPRLAADGHRLLRAGSWSGFYGEVSEPDPHGPSLEAPYVHMSRHLVERLAESAAEAGAHAHVGGTARTSCSGPS
ncbi:asparagine synthase-related protein [Saccharopolyspora sp. CA-218241]|uniref:asparagine synthase-related protein n=1 Tax=Saccharopolyspora sp. CA-218241 TaxID=3240027 RepID=UPI003D99B327